MVIIMPIMKMIIMKNNVKLVKISRMLKKFFMTIVRKRNAKRIIRKAVAIIIIVREQGIMMEL